MEILPVDKYFSIFLRFLNGADKTTISVIILSVIVEKTIVQTTRKAYLRKILSKQIG